MKHWIPLGVAAATVAFVLLRPVPPPAPTLPAWSTEPSAPGRPHPPTSRAAERAVVYVAGAVARPGVYRIGPDARAKDALALAGGARPDADLVAVNLAAHVADGDEIAVPVRGETSSRAVGGHRRTRHRPAAGTRHGRRAKRRHRAEQDGPPPPNEVDVNTADADTLATIPGIGAGLAERIVAFRSQNGPFASVDELLDVAGITDARLDALLPYVVAR